MTRLTVTAIFRIEEMLTMNYQICNAPVTSTTVTVTDHHGRYELHFCQACVKHHGLPALLHYCGRELKRAPTDSGGKEYSTRPAPRAETQRPPSCIVKARRQRMRKPSGWMGRR